MKKEAVIRVKQINKIFGHGKSKVHALKNVDLEINRGEIISIVGESGSGKTTLAKIILGLLNKTDGEIFFEGEYRDLSSHKKRVEYWEKVQAIFQDPFASFNRFYTVKKLFDNCIKLRKGNITKVEAEKIMIDACFFVNLDYHEVKDKHFFEMSGGQMQRIMIARIFIIHPEVLIADEPTSMIDACSRATILNMLMKLRDDNDMTIIFITHDLGLAYYVSDEVYIMEKGKVVERGKAETVIGLPKHNYTKQLLSDVPKLHETWISESDMVE